MGFNEQLKQISGPDTKVYTKHKLGKSVLRNDNLGMHKHSTVKLKY